MNYITKIVYICFVLVHTFIPISCASDTVKSINIVSKNISYYFNDHKIDLPEGYSTFEYQDRIYVPVRFIAENIGLEVVWKEDNTVTFKELFVRTPSVENSSGQENKKEETLQAVLVQAKYVFNGAPIEMKDDYVTIMVNDRFYVPIRFVTEASGREIKWDETAQSVSIRELNSKWGIHEYNGTTYCFDYDQLVQSKNGENTCLCDGSSIQIYNNYIYRTSYKDRELWRISLDGKDKVLLEKKVMAFYIDEAGKMYRVKWDEQQRCDVIISDVLLQNEVKIKEKAEIYFALYYCYGYIYYITDGSKDQPPTINRMDMNGKNDTVICSLPNDYTGFSLGDENTIYYTMRAGMNRAGYYGTIYKFNIKEKTTAKIIENGYIYSFRSDEKNIFYTTEVPVEGDFLWETDPDGKNKKLLYSRKEGFSYFGVDENNIYVNENDIIYEIDRETLQKKELLNIYIDD